MSVRWLVSACELKIYSSPGVQGEHVSSCGASPLGWHDDEGPHEPLEPCPAVESLDAPDIKIRHEAIGCVTINKHLLFADVTIETRGGQVIVARGFTRSDTEQIASLIG